jgi:hypothetical protein
LKTQDLNALHLLKRGEDFEEVEAPESDEERMRPKIGPQTKVISDVVVPIESAELGVLKMRTEEPHQLPESESFQGRNPTSRISATSTAVFGPPSTNPRAWEGLYPKRSGVEVPTVSVRLYGKQTKPSDHWGACGENRGPDVT